MRMQTTYDGGTTLRITVILILVSHYSSASMQLIVTNITLLGGQSPNEGRVEYLVSGAPQWNVACGTEFGFPDASVICRQLGYPGTNVDVNDWKPIIDGSQISEHSLECNGDESSLSECATAGSERCSTQGGVICYDHSYQGCFRTPGSAQQVNYSVCKTGSRDMTIAHCVGLCHRTNDTFIYAGVHDGDSCYCVSGVIDLSQLNRREDKKCAAKPCTGRPLESCGGDMFTAVFNVSQYVENNGLNATGEVCGDDTTMLPSPSMSAQSSPTSMTTVHSVSTHEPASSGRRTTPTTMDTTILTEMMSSTLGNKDMSPDFLTANGPYIGIGGGVFVILIIVLVLVVWFMKRRSVNKAPPLDDGIPLSSLSQPERGSSKGNQYVYTDPTEIGPSSAPGTDNNRHVNPIGVIRGLDDEDDDYDSIMASGQTPRNRSSRVSLPETRALENNTGSTIYHVLESTNRIPVGKTVDLPPFNNIPQNNYYALPKKFSSLQLQCDISQLHSVPDSSTEGTPDDFSHLYAEPNKTDTRYLVDPKSGRKDENALGVDDDDVMVDNVLYVPHGKDMNLDNAYESIADRLP